jgi:shikimate dehydrogenase
MQVKDKFGIVGFPVKHSLSPLIHNQWLMENNIQAKYQLLPCENSDDLESFLLNLKNEGFVGVNVTLPYKNLAFEIVKKFGFEISPEAEVLGAVNTIDFVKNSATNTDVYGFEKICKIYDDDHVLVIGGGGVASSVVMACQNVNMNANVTIANRTVKKAEVIAENLMCDLYSGEISKIDLANFDIVINATSLGLNGEDLPVNYKKLGKSIRCFDTIYSPKFTPFLENAKKRGCYVQNGAMMLVHQAEKSFKFWTDKPANVDLARKIMKDFLIA